MILFFFSPHRICRGRVHRKFYLLSADDIVFGFRELDHAMLRRLEKRVLVGLPSTEARQAMFRQFLPPTVIQEGNGLELFADLDYVRLSQVSWSLLLIQSVGASPLVRLSSAPKAIRVRISS